MSKEKRSRVIVVDDEILIGDMVKRAMSVLLDTEVPYFTNGADALEYLEENREQPVDLVISDIQMPFMDGLTLARKVKEQFPKTIIVLMSADQLKSKRQATLAIEEGYVNLFVGKPFQLTIFKEIIKKYLGE